MTQSISNYLSEAIELLERMKAGGLEPRLDGAIESITAALARRLPVLVCGHGGSASDAMRRPAS